MEKFAGIDLAGSEKRNTGVCLIKSKKIYVGVMHTDEEIIDFIKNERPNVIAIDAPLFLPKGSKGLNGKFLRECDKELVKMHIKFFPINFGPMKMLTKRGIRLKKIFLKALGRKNVKVIETYPGAVYDLFKIKREDKEIKKFLEKFWVKLKGKASRDELDAITCAIVAKSFYNNTHMRIGSGKEGFMYLLDNKKFLDIAPKKQEMHQMR